MATVKRTFTLPDALWNEALAVAERKGESVASVLRKALRTYVAVNAHVIRKNVVKTDKANVVTLRTRKTV